MPTKHDRAEMLSPRAEQLAGLARSELGELSHAQRSAGLRALNERLDGRRRPFYLAPKAAFAFAAVVAIVAFGIGRFAVVGSSGVALSYEVDGAKPTALGVVEATERARTLRFSDGTEVAVWAGARARVRAVDDKGAQLSVEDGKIGVRVTPRPSAEWSVSAGPFLIRVTGTSFTSEWEADAARLDVRLEHGSVTVTGPVVDEPIRLRAGQQLMIRLREREVVIRDLEPPGAQRADVPVAERANVPGPSTPSLDTPSPSGSAAEAPTTAETDSKPSSSSQAAPAALKWSAELSTGNFDAILQDAKARGIDNVLRTTSSDELAALADAARFRQQNPLARRALTAQRERFPRSSRARDAAFLLGRLEEASGAGSQAVVWYDRYLTEAASGTYASEALGRKMMLMPTLEGKERAREVAQEYLRRFPSGAYAKAAKSLGQPL